MPRRFVGKYTKWQRNYLGPYLVVKVLPPSDFVLQKTNRSTAFVAHADKLKSYFGETPKSWLENSAAGPTDSNGTRLTPLMVDRPQHDDDPGVSDDGDELCNAADDELFGKAMRLSNHVLYTLIPLQTSASQRYNLRHRSHSLQLPPHTTSLSDSNFIIRMLYKETY